jgi:hypothetical protein
MLKLKLSKQIPSEHAEQANLVKWLELIQHKYNLRFFAVPNGSIHRTTKGGINYGQIAKLKAEGVKNGAPDLIIWLSDGTTLNIEMKRQAGGVVSIEQKNNLAWCLEHSHKYFICKGFDEAKTIIEGFLKQPSEMRFNRIQPLNRTN